MGKSKWTNTLDNWCVYIAQRPDWNNGFPSFLFPRKMRLRHILFPFRCRRFSWFLHKDHPSHRLQKQERAIELL